MHMPDANPIEKSKLLLVEGKDEVNFFGALLKHLGNDGIEIREVGGKDKFPKEFPALLNDPGFTSVRSYAIIRDADDSEKNTLASVRGLLKKHRQPVPDRHGSYAAKNDLRAGVFIMPGNAGEGMLEDLCLKTVAGHPVNGCVNAYIKCLREVLEQRKASQAREDGCFYFPRNISKAKAQTFLAGLEKNYPSVGVAAQGGCWDFNHEALEPLRLFLDGL